MDEYDAIGPVNALGDELRAFRHQAGLRLEDLAPKLHLSHQMVGAMERGVRAATRKTAELCDEVFGTPGTFLRLWRRQAKHAIPSQVSPYYDLEAEATRIHKWELRCLSGLLQTESYARAIMQTRWPRGADQTIEDDIRARIEQQHILTKDNPPLAWFVLDESMLYKPYGDMRRQIEHLILLTELPHVIIQIMPFAATEHPGNAGPMTILEFEDAPSISYAEGWGSGRLIESPRDVATTVACYDLIRAAALSQSESLTLLKNLEGRNEIP